ncbi:MAG: hypothetical protein OJF50_004254 [Nitrospira sp.]|nr:hypothetical protein [Nitrospira sp.]
MEWKICDKPGPPVSRTEPPNYPDVFSSKHDAMKKANLDFLSMSKVPVISLHGLESMQEDIGPHLGTDRHGMPERHRKELIS